MAGLVPVIPMGKLLTSSNRDHRHKAGDGVRRRLALYESASQDEVRG
jgi:hypothetical protein